MLRDRMIRVVVSEDELEKAKDLANALGLSVSAYIRHKIITTEPPPKTRQKPSGRRVVRRTHDRAA